MPLGKPLYLTTDISDLTNEEISRVNWSIDQKNYRTQKYGPNRQRRAYLARNFGISQEDYDSILAYQGGRCSICGTSENIDGRIFSLDHSHENGKIRGLLCSRCNLGLGSFLDNAENLRKAAKYLEETPVSKMEKSGKVFGENLEEFVGRRSPKERKDIDTKELIDFYKSSSSNSLRDAEKKFGLSDGQIYQRLKKAGVDFRGNHESRKYPEGFSWCSGHQKFFPLDSFWRDTRRPNGLDSRCKDCRREAKKKSNQKWIYKHTSNMV